MTHFPHTVLGIYDYRRVQTSLAGRIQNKYTNVAQSTKKERIYDSQILKNYVHCDATTPICSCWSSNFLTVE